MTNCKGARNKLFDFTNECVELRDNFKSVTNQLKKDSANQYKRVKMLVARNKYRGEINHCKNKFKESKVNIYGLDRYDPKHFCKSIKGILNINNQSPSNIEGEDWANYFKKNY